MWAKVKAWAGLGLAIGFLLLAGLVVGPVGLGVAMILIYAVVEAS